MKRSQHVPYHSLKCYACDNTARGVRDRRIEGGVVEAACKRHADPKIRACAACIGCLESVREAARALLAAMDASRLARGT
jgi:hypothetical protein